MDKVRLQKIRELFRRAEDRFKVLVTRIERDENGDIVTGLFIPSVNQLRYAGYHILEYVTTEAIGELDEAESHCKRAIYDVYQMELLFYLRQFQTFQQDFHDMPISETVAPYLDWQLAHNAVRELIEQKSESPNREQFYGILEPHIVTLGKIYLRLPLARENLNTKRAQKDRESQVNARGVRLGVGMGFVALVVALLAWVFPETLKEWRQAMFQTAPIVETTPASSMQKQ